MATLSDLAAGMALMAMKQKAKCNVSPNHSYYVVRLKSSSCWISGLIKL